MKNWEKRLSRASCFWIYAWNSGSFSLYSIVLFSGLVAVTSVERSLIIIRAAYAPSPNPFQSHSELEDAYLMSSYLALFISKLDAASLLVSGAVPFLSLMPSTISERFRLSSSTLASRCVAVYLVRRVFLWLYCLVIGLWWLDGADAIRSIWEFELESDWWSPFLADFRSFDIVFKRAWDRFLDPNRELSFTGGPVLSIVS